MKKSIVILCTLLVMLPGFAFAQEDWGFSQGDWAVTFAGSGTSDNDGDNTTISGDAGVGYFFTDSFEVGVRQGLGYTDVEGGNDQWNASTVGFIDYHFDLNRWQPFLGINLGYLYGDNVNETWIAGPEGGLKVFLVRDAFLMALVQYNFTFDDADEAEEAFDDGRFVYTLGFGINF